MKNKIDQILLGILWLLAVALGTCFWFNTNFSFNIFSGAHWRYLAYLQASQQSVQSLFYISLTVAMVIAIGGLYFFMQPKRRKIVLPIVQTTTPPPQTTSQSTASPAYSVPPATPQPATQQVTTQPVPHQTPTQTPPQQQLPATPTITPPTSVNASRPPRLNMPMRPSAATTAPATPHTPAHAAPSTTPGTAPAFPELAQIFTASGFITKQNPKIENIPITLTAIGTNETIWLGGMGIRISDMRRVMDKLAQVFSDTLDDVYININAFVIAAPDAPASTDDEILKFDSIAHLRQYMAGITNPPPAPDDQENFDAFSEYIDTVINYIGKS